MQQTDHSLRTYWICLLLLSLMLGSGPDAFAGFPCKKVKDGQQENLIRIAGQIIEESSQRAVRNATVMVLGGELALASKKTDEEGRFEFFIPAKKIASLEIRLRINYQNHIFAKDDIAPISQDIMILINGTVLLEENPMAEYSIPIHKLDDPKIGQVMIRF